MPEPLPGTLHTGGKEPQQYRAVAGVDMSLQSPAMENSPRQIQHDESLQDPTKAVPCRSPTIERRYYALGIPRHTTATQRTKFACESIVSKHAARKNHITPDPTMTESAAVSNALDVHLVRPNGCLRVASWPAACKRDTG